MKMVGLKCCSDTYKAAISNGCLVCMGGLCHCEWGCRGEEEVQADAGHRGTLSEIEFCAVSRLESSARLSLFRGAMTLIDEPIRLQLKDAVAIFRAG